MAKKSQKFKCYSEEFKLKAVNLYQERGMSYKAITKALGIPSSTQVRQWVRKFNSGEGFMDKRGKSRSGNHPFIGRPRTKFSTVEEERDYLKAQVEYLKKRNPNLHLGGRYGK
ncbi:transposase family protein [Brevibacillus laterosporus GI-9]|nr:transposase family protein [Brevibacillus laterosporus GI-9]